MVKSKDSMTSAQRAALAHVNAYISETQPKVDAVIDRVKSSLASDYGTERYDISADDAAAVREALERYEPGVTEEEIAEIIYGGDNYGEVVWALDDAIAETWDSQDDFYMTWSALKNMTEQRKRLIAGQLVMMI